MIQNMILKTKLVWIAITATTFILFMILPGAVEGWKKGSTQSDPQIIKVFYVIAGINFVLGFVIPKFLKGFKEKLSQQPLSEESKFNFRVVQWALFESIALLGFVSCSIAKTVETYYPFWGLCLLGLILTFPKKEITTLGQ
ncbi:MAG: hypothetical protein IT286_04130 [Proteobacteria bacterium]|jgi:hypothetical protein|nr:hypothetical protein [Pseudomonadota bacterium]